MLSVNNVHQFFSPGEDFLLSDLGSSESSNVVRIQGEAPGQGTLLTWAPDLEVPLIRTVKSNRSYWIQSKSSGVFPYSLGLNSSGYHEQNNWIERIAQFFTFRGHEPFQLDNLSASVKSKIRRIHKVSSSGDVILAWSPTAVLNPFVELASDVTCIVESIPQGFVPYDIGIPLPFSSSSSSSDVGPLLEFLTDALLPEIGLLPHQY